MKEEGNQFFLSKRNRRGLFLLIGVSLIVVFFPRIYFYFQKHESYRLSSSEIQTFKRNLALNGATTGSSYSKKKKVYNRPQRKFDPNQYLLNDWLKLGLSKKQAKVVLKFTKYGLKSNADLKRIFVIPNELFVLIKDSTFYPQKVESRGFNQTYQLNEKTVKIVELNEAQISDLMELPGIGEFYAQKIIQYRDRLGGYCSKEQLLELWKFDIEKLNQIENKISVDPSKIKLIDLNDVSVETLKSHPYLNWNKANSIVKLRQQRGRFTTIENIKESVLVDQELFEKLKPYLTL